MKKFLLNIVAWKLGFIARLTIKKNRPKIIGITGSVGKTSTKKAIETILRQLQSRVRASGGNLNNEIGLPLAILGDYEASKGFLFLSKAILRGSFNLIFGSPKKYPDVLILEYAADHPGDIERLIKIVKPDIALVTAVGETPVHIEFYDNVSRVVVEKAKLPRAVSESGAVILNGDDKAVANMKNISKGKVKTYGFGQNNDLVISNFRTTFSGNFPKGVSFTLKTPGKEGNVELKNVLGKSLAYSSAAAVAVALTMSFSFEKTIEAINKYNGEKGRGRLIPGIKGSMIMDDSYNAAPDSMANAIDAIKNIKAKKIAVLGDMLELGEHSDEAHKRIGRMAGGAVDILLAVGSQAEIVTQAASSARIKKSNIYTFKSSRDAASKLEQLIKGGELILIKGSQSIRTEQVVKSVMKNPEEAMNLLVRQYGKWLKS